MAFHVACPITCRKICFCSLGFTPQLQNKKGKDEFKDVIFKVETFLNDPWSKHDSSTVEVKVPKVEVVSTPLPVVSAPQLALGIRGNEGLKSVEVEKEAVLVPVVNEDNARTIECSDLVVASVENTVVEEQGQSNTKIVCLLCSRGDSERNERARKMLSCNTCQRKYHRSCLKSWSKNRDLFHWSSWTCPSCRICEECKTRGKDPNKLMFCKRCDAARHCYCQHPPHKNVGHGPYLCSKHTKCHSCDSSVPGNGQSVRWFLGNTCCDACGRLFVKNNYCPVCLKVYRDSESTPMVCCDICEKWVHCPCDGISNSKYLQFQADGNLQYVCPTCRGECRQIRSLEEAVKELWKRRDEADKDLIASLRAAAGLPTREEIFDISPFSDDEESGPVVKNEYARSFKISLRGVGDNSPRKNKEHERKSSSKKSGQRKGNEDVQISGEPDTLSPLGGNLNGGVCSVDEDVASKLKYVEDISATNGNRPSRTIKIKSSKPPGLAKEETLTNLPKTAPKLVIHLGGRSKTSTVPTKSEGLGISNGQEFATLNGKRGFGGIDSATKSGSGVSSGKKIRYSTIKHAEDEPTISGDLIDDSSRATLGKDRKPTLKFKIPNNANNGNQSSLEVENENFLPLPGKNDITYTRGQRSKRRRPSSQDDEETSQWGEDNTNTTIKDFSDARWILQKLGKDAAGKRVEIHHPSDDSWHRGTVDEFVEGTSMVSIALDSGKAKTFELWKQGIRFVSQKQKR